MNNLLYKSRPPIDTLEFTQGEVKRLVFIDGRLAEDGMSTIVYYGKADKKRFGNLYSKSEAKNLLIILNIVKNRHPNIGYIEILEEYLY